MVSLHSNWTATKTVLNHCALSTILLEHGWWWFSETVILLQKTSRNRAQGNKNGKNIWMEADFSNNNGRKHKREEGTIHSLSHSYNKSYFPLWSNLQNHRFLSEFRMSDMNFLCGVGLKSMGKLVVALIVVPLLQQSTHPDTYTVQIQVP